LEIEAFWLLFEGYQPQRSQKIRISPLSLPPHNINPPIQQILDYCPTAKKNKKTFVDM